MQTKDNGDWLSAQQAVQADGSERNNLPLINKKLPPLIATIPETTSATVLEEKNPNTPLLRTTVITLNAS